MDFMDLLHYLQILKMLYLSLYYLGNLCKIFMTRNSLENFENIVAIWLLKYFMKLLGRELCISNTLWAFDMVLSLCHDIGDYPICVTTLSVWRSICVTTSSVWRPVYVTTPSMWWPVCVTTLSCGLGWGFWIWNGSQWIICSFIVTLRSLVLQYVYHSCHDVNEIYLQNSNGNLQILACL